MFSLLGTVVGTPDGPNFTDAINSYGSAIANGLMPILLVVLGVAAVFTLYKVGVHAIRSWIGRGKATSVFAEQNARTKAAFKGASNFEEYHANYERLGK